jgi:hypothetical protein
MALFHINASVICKGKSQGGAVGFARYLTGTEIGSATRTQRYLEREGHGRDDLVESGSGALPSWAKDGAHFFTMADRYERSGGVVARHFEIHLPRELSPQGRLDLAADMRAAFFERYPHVYAVHCPPTRDGSGENPHLHVMFSTRRDDGIERTPKAWFGRAANAGMALAQGGVRKDRIWDAKRTLQAVRAEAATLINAALEREGQPYAVSHERLVVRGAGRPALGYGNEATSERVAAVLAERDRLHADFHPLENEMNRAAWQSQQQREGIRDLSREAIVDQVRDRFWSQDHSGYREQERAESLLRSVGRELSRVPQEPMRGQPPHEQDIVPQRRHGSFWRSGRVDLMDETPHPSGLKVRLRDDHEYERGYGR